MQNTSQLPGTHTCLGHGQRSCGVEGCFTEVNFWSLGQILYVGGHKSTHSVWPPSMHVHRAEQSCVMKSSPVLYVLSPSWQTDAATKSKEFGT